MMIRNALHGMPLATRAFLLSRQVALHQTQMQPNTIGILNSYFSHTTKFFGLPILKVQGEMSLGDSGFLPTAANSVYGHKRLQGKLDGSAYRF